MQCLQLTRGEPPATKVDVALSGSFNESYGYVTIDGTKYTSAQTLTVAKGTSVTVYCSSKVRPNMSKITLNGTTVAQGGKESPAEYTFAATDNCTIVLSKTSASQYSYYSAVITMPA